MYMSFKELPIWQQAIEIAEQIFHLTEGLPRKEDYGLTSQIRRSALSISANIAEAYGRNHSSDKMRFYFYSRGSITETQSHLEYARRVQYLDKAPVEIVDEKLERLHKDLNKVIATLRNSQ